MLEQTHLPDFLENSLSGSGDFWPNFKTRWVKFSAGQKLAFVLLVMGLSLNCWGWLVLRQNLNQFQDLNIHIEQALDSRLKNPNLFSSVESVMPLPVASEAGMTRITVHLAGAVKNPGIYQLAAGSLLADAVKAAGGVSSAVWQDYFDLHINLAEPLEAAQKIWIPSLSQQVLIESSRSPLLSPGQGSVKTVALEGAGETGLGISVNQASLPELMSLPGIGQKRAEDIIANRPYATVEELMTKAGLSLTVFSAIKMQLVL